MGGMVVFKNHWLAFTPAAWVLNGLYIAALVSFRCAGWRRELNKNLPNASFGASTPGDLQLLVCQPLGNSLAATLKNCHSDRNVAGLGWQVRAPSGRY